MKIELGSMRQSTSVRVCIACVILVKQFSEIKSCKEESFVLLVGLGHCPTIKNEVDNLVKLVQSWSSM